MKVNHLPGSLATGFLVLVSFPTVACAIEEVGYQDSSSASSTGNSFVSAPQFELRRSSFHFGGFDWGNTLGIAPGESNHGARPEFQVSAVVLDFTKILDEAVFRIPLKPNTKLLSKGYLEQHSSVEIEMLQSTSPFGYGHYTGGGNGGSPFVAFSFFAGRVRGVAVGIDFGPFYFDYTQGVTYVRVLRPNNSPVPGRSLSDDEIDPVLEKEVTYVGPPKAGRPDDSDTTNSTNSDFDDLPQDLEVNLLVALDQARMEQLDNNLTAARFSAEASVNEVSAIYRAADFENHTITVKLAGLVLEWDPHPEHGEVAVNSNNETNATHLIQSVNEFRRNAIDGLPEHTTAMLISGREMMGSLIGLAYLDSVCDDTSACHLLQPGFCYEDEAKGCCERNAFGIVQAVSNTPVSHVMAHELGHQLGMRHDSDGNACESSGYLMGATSSQNTSFSSCSIAEVVQRIAQTPKASGFHPYECLGVAKLSSTSRISVSLARIMLAIVFVASTAF